MSNSLSLLNELKDIAKEAAEREKTQPVSQQMERNPTPKPSSSSSSFSLSEALADVHKLVDEEARAEQKMRSKTKELALAAREAERVAEEDARQQEMASRLAAEEVRRKNVAEERRLIKLREEYESALARGENIEMPLDLRPPEPTPPPQEIQAPEVLEKQHIQQAVQSHQKPFIIGGVAAFITIAAALYIFVISEPPPAPKVEKQVEMISFEEKKAEIDERKRIEKERMEAEALAKIAAAKAAAEQKEVEEAKRKEKSRARRRTKRRRKAKKKNSFGVSLDGF